MCSAYFSYLSPVFKRMKWPGFRERGFSIPRLNHNKYETTTPTSFIHFFAGCTTTQVTQALKEANKAIGTSSPSLTTAEVAEGLKEALIKGISIGADQVSQLDGYFKKSVDQDPFPSRCEESGG